MRIGDLLIQAKFLTDEQLESALQKQKLSKKTPIGQLLVILNFLSESELELVLQAQRKILFSSLTGGLAVSSLKYARQHRISFDEATQQLLAQMKGSVSGQYSQLKNISELKSESKAINASGVKPEAASAVRSKAASVQVQGGVALDKLVSLSQEAAAREDWTEAATYTEQVCKFKEEQHASADSILPFYCMLVDFCLKGKQYQKLEKCNQKIIQILQKGGQKLAASTVVKLAEAASHCLSAGMLKFAQEIFAMILPQWTELLPYESTKYSECLKESLSCEQKLNPIKKVNLKIGELLKMSGLIDPEQFQQALQQSKKERQPLGRVLVQAEIIELRVLRNAAKVQLMCRSALIPASSAGMILIAACNTQLSSTEFFYRIQSVNNNKSQEAQAKLTAEIIAKMDEMILLEESRGTNHPDTAVLAEQVGDLCLQRGELEEAELMFRRAHAVFAVSGEAYQNRLADQCKKIGRLLIGHKKYPEAELILLQAMEIKSRLLGEMHPDMADILLDIGFLYYCQASYAAAIGFLRSAWMMQQDASSASAKRHVLELLIKCFDQSGQGAEAGVYREQLKVLDESNG